MYFLYSGSHPSSSYKLKKKLDSNLKKVPEYFHIGNRKENIALCQIRNEASNLNLHLYDHHLTDRIENNIQI
jgi:hypothetical protein